MFEKGLTESKGNLRIDKTPGQDSDEASPRYKSEAQVLDTTYSVMKYRGFENLGT